jgi:triacylglycerol lipase
LPDTPHSRSELCAAALVLFLLVACAGKPDPERPARSDADASQCELVVGAPSRGQIGWLRKLGLEAGPNVTARFRSLLAEVRAGREVIPSHADRFVYLLVPGLASSYQPSYMRANLRALSERGLRAEKLELESEQPVETNARILRERILEQTRDGRQAVLLGHSKGGLEASAALALFPELRPRVRALVTIQSPYAGSAIATDIAACPPIADLLRNIIVWLGDDPEAVQDLTYEDRRAFVTAHPHPQEVPTLCLASSRSDWRSIFAAPAGYLRERYDQASDGMVAPDDAVIPGARWVELDDMDHGESVLAGVRGFANYEPGNVTQVLVALALAE